MKESTAKVARPKIHFGGGAKCIFPPRPVLREMGEGLAV
jgi:hypothetical protein